MKPKFLFYLTLVCLGVIAYLCFHLVELGALIINNDTFLVVITFFSQSYVKRGNGNVS